MEPRPAWDINSWLHLPYSDAVGWGSFGGADGPGLPHARVSWVANLRGSQLSFLNASFILKALRPEQI